MHRNGTLRWIPGLSSFFQLFDVIPADYVFLRDACPGRFHRRSRRLRGHPRSGLRRLRHRFWRSGNSGGPQVGCIDPARKLCMGGSNEVACRGASRHPPHDFHFSPVDEAAEKGPLVVKEGRPIFSTGRTIDEQLPAYSEDWAGAPPCCWTS
jgi:hypothetical protein